MRLELTEREVERALGHYAVSVVTSGDPALFDFDVVVQWRARKAIVEVRRKVPVLVDTAEGHTG
jgi:hypothetical protein